MTRARIHGRSTVVVGLAVLALHGCGSTGSTTPSSGTGGTSSGTGGSAGAGRNDGAAGNDGSGGAAMDGEPPGGSTDTCDVDGGADAGSGPF